ncbi:MAG: hypothetical protein ACK4UN_09945 [Limisphaerales bacterium]
MKAQIEIKISGERAVGKTCLANKLAIWLAEQGHDVSLIDAADGKRKPNKTSAALFTEPRKIKVEVARA